MRNLLLLSFLWNILFAFDQTTNDAWLLKETGKKYQTHNQPDSAVYFYLMALKIAEEQRIDSLISSINYQAGLTYLETGQYQKALEHAYIAFDIDKINNDAKSIAATLNAIALIYQHSGVLEKALEYQLESIKLSEQTGRKDDIAIGFYNLGNIYKEFGKFQKALDYFEQAKKAFERILKNKPDNFAAKLSLSETIYSLGDVKALQKQYKEAEDYLQASLRIKQEINDLQGISNIYNRLADVLTYQNKLDDALQLLFKAIYPKQQISDKQGLAIVYSNIGKIHFLRNDLNSAENFLHKSSSIAKETGNFEILSTNAGLLTKIYKSKKRMSEALEYMELADAYKDSLTKLNNRKIIEEMSVRFETDKKEQENQILTLSVKRQKTVRNYLVATTFLVVLIGIIIYRQYLQKKKSNYIISKKNIQLEIQNQQINEQKKLIEEKKKDLTDSIEYAKKIQESLLAKSNELKTKLDDFFILFKPKDIVSGDFYWTGEKDNKLIISAVDCTGHGVPGAFMSMLGDSYLNQIVYNLEITSPDNILTELDKFIKEALKQEDTNNQDGMDMALCTIDKKTKTVEFAGAKNPLIYIQNGEAKKIKGSRKPIGGSLEQGNGFELHTIKVEEPTTFYMFSDGYQDQFGGPENKKFMVKKLQNLLIELHNKPMKEQSVILNETIIEWMKNHEQIDDILVVGFKIS